MKTMTLLLCLALPVATLAGTDRVYRWTDKDGVVHYSQTEPAKVRAEMVKIQRAKEVPPPAPPTSAPVIAEKPTTANAENCAIAQANAKILAGQKSISVDKDGDGKLDPVNDEDRKNIQAETEKQIGTFCK